MACAKPASLHYVAHNLGSQEAGLGEGLDVHSRVVFKHSKVNVA